MSADMSSLSLSLSLYPLQPTGAKIAATWHKSTWQPNKKVGFGIQFPPTEIFPGICFHFISTWVPNELCAIGGGAVAKSNKNWPLCLEGPSPGSNQVPNPDGSFMHKPIIRNLELHRTAQSGINC